MWCAWIAQKNDINAIKCALTAQYIGYKIVFGGDIMAKDGMTRINCYLDDSLVAKIDDYAAKMHISRTSAISVLLSSRFEQTASVETLAELTKMLGSMGAGTGG